MNNVTPPIQNKAVLVLSSHVVRGSVGNRAVAFALETLGHPTWVVPTITLPWHPGHNVAGSATRIIASDPQFSALCEELADAPWRAEIAGVISGFLANAEQASAVAKLVAKLKSENDQLIYLCDPVIGDFPNAGERVEYGGEGRLYVKEEIAAAINDQLLPLADIATPNMFELGWLNLQQSIENQSQLLAAASALVKRHDIESLLITSVPALMRSNIGSVLVRDNQAIMSEHKALPNPPNGLGDLASALFLSHCLNGLEGQKALEKTTASVFEVLARTAKSGSDELTLESNTISLSRPMAMVQMRRLVLPR